MKTFIAAIFAAGTLLASCDKNDLAGLSGTYAGIFIYTNPASSVAPAPSGPASVSFNGTSYTSTGNPNRIPAGGSGTFIVSGSKTIKFQDTNIWTADFDGGLVLGGEYTCKIKGDSLYLSKYNTSGFKVYEYLLKRVTN